MVLTGHFSGRKKFRKTWNRKSEHIISLLRVLVIVGTVETVRYSNTKVVIFGLFIGRDIGVRLRWTLPTLK